MMSEHGEICWIYALLRLAIELKLINFASDGLPYLLQSRRFRIT